ncbi:MAG: GHKL domain-containing protein [Firmicutes bacterium]|nr:GHKL domain-containing protein [Bacillota bacterium]
MYSKPVERLIILLMIETFLILLAARVVAFYNHQITISDLLIIFVAVCNYLIVVLVIKWLFNMDFVTQKLNMHSEAAEEALRLIRSERHEFVNHLHSVYGLMVTGEHEEAAQYLKNVGTDCRFNSWLLSIPNAPLRVLLENKRGMASTRGIAFTLEVQSDMKLFHMGSKDITTVFGNILDNAIAAVTEHDNNTQKEIKFTIVETSGSYHFSIMNSGPAIDEKIAGKMFEDGFSTKGNYRGYGLALVRKTVNSYGGRVLYSEEDKSFWISIPKSQTNHSLPGAIS